MTGATAAREAGSRNGTARRALARSPLWQLTRARVLSFMREPEVAFWVFAFPVLMALALGIAFRTSGAPRSRVGVEQGPRAAEIAAALARSSDLEVVPIAPAEADAALRRGKVAVLVRAGAAGPPELVSDPTRPESRLARLATADALERAAGRVDVARPRAVDVVRPGSRYIDFLLPGLIGLNLLGTGMWGLGFAIANWRQQKLLRRLTATPMRRGDFLLALMLARMVWLVLEVGVILGFGALAFGTAVRGSWLAFTLVTVLGTIAFSAIGLLVAMRARTIEAVSGLMNVVQLPMWLLSGTFFSSERFPAAIQPLIQALPLTLVNNALRAIMNEGAGLGAVAPAMGMLVAWGLVCFYAALRWFRWE
ncbi:MAG TPA: ABC transporter permease [Candidatus Eisenbacteria bacterium]